jgi:integrase
MDHRESGIRAKRESGNAWRHDRGHPEMPSLQDVTFADHLKPAVVVSLNTGVRQGELFSLCWTDINFEDAQLTVRGDTAKSGRTRHVPLNADAVEALRDWKRQCDPTHALVLPTEAVQVRPRSMAKASAERTYAARALTWFLLAGGHKPMARVVALTVCALLDLDPEDGVDEKQVRDVTEDICKRFKTPRPSRRQSRILGT